MTISKPLNRFAKLGFALGLFVLLALAEPILATTGRYTAQRKPRVTVMEFENTNSEARQARYGQSVEAMLVTFLKRKSQFIVVERQKLGPVLEEWENNQLGLTNLSPQDSRTREILEKIDGIILGSVTLLKGLPPETSSSGSFPSQEPRSFHPALLGSHRIEIDVKLLSRADGRIIAAVQRSGPVSCLRSIVERLGVALEREFLRPYYGKLTFKLETPENVHLYLTPVLMNDALDEEKPPVERGSTVHIGTEMDTVEPWTTDPTTYTVEDVLSGWYSIRLDRPGYEGTGTENRWWEVRRTRRGLEVYDARTGKPLRSFPPETRRFLVWVDPMDVEQVDGDRLGFTFRKKRGSLEPLVKRQYLDRDYGRPEALRVLLIGEEEIELNQGRRAPEYTEDRMCDFFHEREANPVDHRRTYVAPGQSFDVDQFEGGELVIEDYRGETVPVGQYQMVVWEPRYRLHTAKISVRDLDHDKAIRTTLVRHTVPVVMSTTGPKPGHHGVLRGQLTDHHLSLELDFEEDRRREGLPVDRYSVRTDIPGFGAWRHTLDLLPPVGDPPVYDPDSDEDLPIRFTEAPREPIEIRFKTRLTLAGRVRALGRLPDRKVGDWYEDRRVTEILDRLLETRELKEDQYGLDGGLFADWTPTGFLRDAFAPAAQELERDLRRTAGVPPNRGEGDVAQLLSLLEELEEMDRLDDVEHLEQLRQLGLEALLPETSTGEGAEARPFELPAKPETLRELLTQRLEHVDLLVLDGWDLQRLQTYLEVRSILAGFVETGGALVAFATEPGYYGPVLGVPLSIDQKRKRTRKLRLEPGNGDLLALPEIQQKVRRRRAVPRFDLDKSGNHWRVLAYGHRKGQPRILERGRRQDGGYVLIWGDHPGALEARHLKWARQIDQVRRRVADRAMDWARFLMYREYDDLNQAKTEAEEELKLAQGR